MTPTARISSRSEGVKKSWQTAHELHKHSKNPRSKPGMARSFLAKYPQHSSPASHTVQQAYDEYIKTRRKRRRRRREAAAAAPKPIRATQATMVKQLYDVKVFLEQHRISIPAMKKILDVLQQLSK